MYNLVLYNHGEYSQYLFSEPRKFLLLLRLFCHKFSSIMTPFCVILAEKYFLWPIKTTKIHLAHHLKLYKRPDKRSGLVNPDFPVNKIEY